MLYLGWKKKNSVTPKQLYNRTLTLLHNVISCCSVDARFLPGKRINSKTPASASLPKHNPISVTSLKCILLIGTIHPKCQVSCCCCNRPPQLPTGCRTSREAHCFSTSCAALAFAAISVFHQQGCRSNYGPVWGKVTLNHFFL